jgi:hypothetical protein
LATDVTDAHWQALQAAKTAVSFLPEKEQKVVKHKLFHDNAKLFYGFWNKEPQKHQKV